MLLDQACVNGPAVAAPPLALPAFPAGTPVLVLLSLLVLLLLLLLTSVVLVPLASGRFLRAAAAATVRALTGSCPRVAARTCACGPSFPLRVAARAAATLVPLPDAATAVFALGFAAAFTGAASAASPRRGVGSSAGKGGGAGRKGGGASRPRSRSRASFLSRAL